MASSVLAKVGVSTALQLGACKVSASKTCLNVAAPTRGSFLAGNKAINAPKNGARVFAREAPYAPGSEAPEYLKGELAGDNGFDPLGLGADPANLKWYVQAELQNGRWAMLGAAGALVPEILTKAGLWNAPLWFDAGKAEYFAPASTLFLVELILMGWVEGRRYYDIVNPGSVYQDPIFSSNKLPPGEVGYPGGIFNPLNFPVNKESKDKELANGRLAMLAFLGYIAQSHVTGEGPFANLLAHLADPWHVTVVSSIEKFVGSS
ncbi:light harvesting chlorophyll a b-binding protein [Klebsormidium nitens]|uniref:Chlorophyll a-b binding protein, chloroplastic n=1 Tax=Klebsormidium nitens TaxID=105231 RepID=A0A1Y1HR07_KLENI|nr:light harvesting chlorophyll a b-binding protein [Klebsormidium nitens]|eukprot:GAQ79026.1 light harvesting chlorophyll a b-binding protein [Klebsormidium nitens]